MQMFQSTPACERATSISQCAELRWRTFQSTPACERATRVDSRISLAEIVSIHARV